SSSQRNSLGPVRCLPISGTPRGSPAQNRCLARRLDNDDRQIMLAPRDIIQKKRDRQALSAEEIAAFIRGYMSSHVADYHVSAWLMAVYLNGMTIDETLALTKEMRDSGRGLDLSSIKGRKIDKHSTGGVGDKTSMIVAPIAAACGVTVPMITGRALGHTGGTL